MSSGAVSVPHNRRLLGVATALALGLGLLTCVAALELPDARGCIVRVEFAGSASGYTAVTARAEPRSTTGGRVGADSDRCAGVTEGDVRTSLLWDFVLILLYGATLTAICLMGSRLLYTARTRAVVRATAWCAVAAAFFDVLEDVFLLFAVPSPPHPAHLPDRPFALATAMALAKFVALLPAVAAALLVTVTLLGRSFAWLVSPLVTRFGDWLADGWRRARRGATGAAAELVERVAQAESSLPGLDMRLPAVSAAPEPAPGEPAVHGRVRRPSYIAVTQPEPPPPAGPGGAPAWARSYRVPAEQLAGAKGGTGVCLSGGGIRAATFSMGAVQALAEQGVMANARYLSTVSGGGYFGCAYQVVRMLALDPGLVRYARGETPPPSRPLATHDAFAQGSEEEDFLRRHGEYIADGGAQWAQALFVLLRNSLLGLTLIYASLVLAAWAAGLAYSAPIDWTRGLFPEGAVAPVIGSPVWISLALTLSLGVLAWMLSGVLTTPWLRQAAIGLAGLLGGISVGVFVVGIAVPRVVAWVTSLTTTATSQGAALASSAAPAATVTTIAALAAAVTTLWNALSPNKKGDGQAGIATSLLKRFTSAAGFAVRMLLTFAVLAALLFLAVVAFAAELRNAVVHRLQGSWSWTPLLAALGILLALLVFDQTRMSLHPFYKRRLASAFYVQRRPDGRAAAVSYSETSHLPTYGRPLDPDGSLAGAASGLRLLLCAAAHVSGPHLAPPGRRVVPFVFSSDYVGGPDLGYFRAEELSAAVKGKAYEHDVTLLAAAAISGAAFASAMGRLSGPFDRLLAVSNARLGAWLPNPRYHRLMQHERSRLPPLESERVALPWLRRLQYFVFELAGIYPADDRFVYVTDGGHYENLGLVELLRRRCSTVFCVDASGDHSLAYTLAEGAALAYEELGVVISVHGLDLSTLSATDGEEGNTELRALHKRLSQTSVVTGTITYPPVADAPQRTGLLVVGKAVLGQDLGESPEMFPLTTYAVARPGFPGDSTADQWFDVDKFQGYLTLGRLVGSRMAAEAAAAAGVAAAAT